MLYFAYGSNLNHHQMNNRCDGAKYIKKHVIKGYKLCFSHKTNHSVYGHANIIKNKKSEVHGALWDITRNDEKELDGYEGVDYNYYQKEYFTLKGKNFSLCSKNILFAKSKIAFKECRDISKTNQNTFVVAGGVAAN